MGFAFMYMQADKGPLVEFYLNLFLSALIAQQQFSSQKNCPNLASNAIDNIFEISLESRANSLFGPKASALDDKEFNIKFQSVAIEIAKLIGRKLDDPEMITEVSVDRMFFDDLDGKVVRTESNGRRYADVIVLLKRRLDVRGISPNEYHYENVRIYLDGKDIKRGVDDVEPSFVKLDGRKTFKDSTDFKNKSGFIVTIDRLYAPYDQADLTGKAMTSEEIRKYIGLTEYEVLRMAQRSKGFSANFDEPVSLRLISDDKISKPANRNPLTLFRQDKEGIFLPALVTNRKGDQKNIKVYLDPDDPEHSLRKHSN
jgi:hypothetical protein